MGFLWSIFILQLTQNSFAKACKSSLQIDIIFCDICCDEISSGSVDEAAPTDESKQTNFWQIFKSEMDISITLLGKRILGKL